MERETAAAAKPVDNIGRSYPLGATVVAGGVNFSLFSRAASEMELLFFDREDDARPARVIRIDPADNRTYHYWHVFVPGVQAGQIYGFRVHGPFDPAVVCALTLPRYFLIRTAVASLFRKTTAATPQVWRATTLDRHEKRDRGSERVRLGRRQAAEAPIISHNRL